MTNDNGTGGVSNSTAFGNGHKLTTVLPPDVNGDYTACLTYGRAIAPRVKANAFFPQVTVDKGADGSCDIVVAWTEGDSYGGGPGPGFLAMPSDGDVFYRQVTLTYLGP